MSCVRVLDTVVEDEQRVRERRLRGCSLGRRCPERRREQRQRDGQPDPARAPRRERLPRMAARSRLDRARMLPSRRSLEDRTCPPLPRPLPPPRRQVHLAPRRHPRRDGRGRRPASSNYSAAADCASTLACLRALGVGRPRDGARRRDRQRRRRRRGARPPGVLDAENSGSTLRMLAGALAGRPFRSRADRRRVAAPPAGRARGRAAARDGRDASITTDGRPPLTIEGGAAARDRLRARRWRARRSRRRCCSPACRPRARRPCASRAPSRDHTERMLPAFGVAVERDGPRRDRPRRRAGCAARTSTCPGDASSAAFLVVAALVLPDSEVRARRRAALPHAHRLRRRAARDGRAGRGAARGDASPEPVGSIVASSSALRGTTVDPALVPVADRRGAGARRGRGLRRRARSRSRAPRSCGSRRATASPRSPRASARSGAARARAARRPRGRGRQAAARRGGALARRPPHRDGALGGGARPPSGPTRGRRRLVRRRVVPRLLRAPRAGRPAVPDRPARVVLVGFMGSGKSTVGRILARRLGYAFEDMDRRIEARAGRTIAAIFRDEGEEAFRALEREEARALARLPQAA